MVMFWGPREHSSDLVLKQWCTNLSDQEWLGWAGSVDKVLVAEA